MLFMLYYHTQDKQYYYSKCIALIASINNAYIPFYLLRQLIRTMACNQRNEMCECHYYMRISLLISASLVSLISQNHRLAELMAILDGPRFDSTKLIPDCIDSSLCLSQKLG